ncbi:MAG: hypothetical protein Q9210_006858 [Variospora velana]
MPRLQDYVEKKNPFQDPGLEKNHESVALPELVKGYGFEHHSGVASKLKDLESQPKVRPKSRQEVGYRARVTTPATKLPVSEIDPRIRPQQPSASHHITLATRTASDDRRGALQRGDAGTKSRDMFDTDTEQLDNTSIVDDPVKIEDPSANVLEVVESDARGRQVRGSTEPHTSRAPRKLRNMVKNGLAASPRSVDYAETSTDHDSDDEYDDSLQNKHFQLHGTRGPIYQRREGSVHSPSGNGPPDGIALYHAQQHMHVVDHFSYPPHVPPTFAGPDLPGHPRQYSHGEEVIDESYSGVENPGSLYSPGIDDRSMQIHGLNTGLEGPMHPANFNHTGPRKATVTNKRSSSPEWEFQEPVRSDEKPVASVRDTKDVINGHDKSGNPRPKSQKRPLPESHAHQRLDYDMKALSEMTYRQLAEEAFDTSPQAPHLQDPALTDDSPLENKLLHFHSLDGPREQIQSHRQAFFSSLNIDQYEECGDIMAEQFGRIISKFKQARRQKRSLAKEFENEVAARERVVESRKVAVTKDLDRLKRTGREVLQPGRPIEG